MENFEKIETYLLGKMSPANAAAFEKAMQSDPDLKSETENLKSLIIGVKAEGLRGKLAGKTIATAAAPPQTTKSEAKIFSMRRMAVAASFIGILICSWYFLMPKDDGQSAQYAAAFAPDPGLPTPMSETVNYDFYDGMVDYKMEKFGVALQKWNTLPTVSDKAIGADTLAYYKGMAHLNTEKLTEAEKILKEIPAESSYSNLAKWYLVKIYMDRNELDKVKAMLQQVPSDIHPQYQYIREQLQN